MSVGRGELKVRAPDLAAGSKLRVQLLARDLIVATEPPRNMSVRNMLGGVVASLSQDDADSALIAIDIGGTLIMSRVTAAAVRDLALAPGLPVWVLVMSVSLHSHSFAAPPAISRAPPSA